MKMPVSEIAAAIEFADESILKRLPEIGPKTAKKIIAELQGKMSKFALLQEAEPGARIRKAKGDEVVDEAFYVLSELLHYSLKEAEMLIELAVKENQKYESSEELLQTIFKIRASKNI